MIHTQCVGEIVKSGSDRCPFLGGRVPARDIARFKRVKNTPTAIKNIIVDQEFSNWEQVFLATEQCQVIAIPLLYIFVSLVSGKYDL